MHSRKPACTQPLLRQCTWLHCTLIHRNSVQNVEWIIINYHTMGQFFFLKVSLFPPQVSIPSTGNAKKKAPSTPPTLVPLPRSVSPPALSQSPTPALLNYLKLRRVTRQQHFSVIHSTGLAANSKSNKRKTLEASLVQINEFRLKQVRQRDNSSWIRPLFYDQGHMHMYNVQCER